MRIPQVLVLLMDLESAIFDPNDVITVHGDALSMEETKHRLAKKYNLPQNGYSLQAYFTSHLIEVKFTNNLQR